MLQAQIFLDNDDFRETVPMYQYIMKLLLNEGIAGATSFSGESGYGKNNLLQQPNQQFSFDNTPILITFIDEDDKVKHAITEVRKKFDGGLIVTHSVEKW